MNLENYDLVCSVIEHFTCCPREDFTPKTLLSSLGLDDTDLEEIHLMLSEEIGIKIPDALFASATTICGLTYAITRTLEPRRTSE